MLKLSNLIQNTSAIAAAAAPSEFAMHALNRDANGLITYTKVLWANTSETVNLTDGTGFAYNGIEEFISGQTLSGTEHNLTLKTESISGEKDIISNTFFVRVNGGQFYLNGNTTPNIPIELRKGSTYKFITEDYSTQTHPIFISTTATSGSYSGEYLKGVEYSRSANNGGTNNTVSQSLIFTVPMDAPKQLYYSSGTDANCYGIIRISESFTNTNKRTYEQVRFDNQKLTYYINANGYLVARYGADYSY
jgi:hypothetical protein